MTKFLLHPQYLDPKHSDYKKAFIYSWAMFVIGLFLLPYCLYFWINYPDDTVKNLTNIVFGGLFMVGLVLGRFSSKLDYAIGFVALISYPPIMISIYHTGGVYSVEVVWIFVCLITQSIFIDYKVGIAGGSIVLIFYGWLFWTEYAHPETTETYKDYLVTHNNINHYLTLIFVTILILALLGTFTRSLTNANKKIEELSRDKIDSLERMLVTKTNELSLIRASLAKDFHDEMGNKLASISILSQALALQKSEQLSTEETKGMLDSINVHAKDLYEGTKDFIWAIDFKHDYVFELYIYLREFGESFFNKLSINFLSETNLTEEQLVRIDPIVGRQLIFICKEMMTNAAKHSGCNEVTMKIDFMNNHVLIQITDNGKGFDIKCVEKRGLSNIMRRTQKTNIDLDTQSGPQGTSYQLKVPLPA